MPLIPSLISAPLGALVPSNTGNAFATIFTSAFNDYLSLMTSSLGGTPDPLSLIQAKSTLYSDLVDIFSQSNVSVVAGSKIGNAIHQAFSSIRVIGGGHGVGPHTNAGIASLINELSELFSSGHSTSDFSSKISNSINNYVKTAVTNGSGVPPGSPDIGNFV